MTEITKIAVSFHWDTFSAFFTLSCRAPAVTNSKMVLQKVVGDPEQKLVGSFAEFKINCGILHCFRRKNILQAS